MLTTRNLLIETMERLFGKVTVRVNRFEGKGREPLGFSANYFCHECLRARGDMDPINSMARKRVVGMSRRVLAEKTDYDPWRFSDVDVNTFFTRAAVEILDRFGLGDLEWSRFLGRKKISFFRQHLALGRTGRYGRSMSAFSACCSRARCIRTRPASSPPSSCSPCRSPDCA